MKQKTIWAVAGLCLLIAGCESMHAEPEDDEPFGLTAEDTGRRTETYEDAKRYLAEGRLNDAEVVLGRLITSNPEDMQARLGLGEVNLRRGKPSQALEAFASIPQDSEHGAAGLQGKGMSLVLINRKAEGRKALLKAVERDPRLWRAWNVLGEIYDRDRKWSESKDAYYKALAIANAEGMQREKAVILNNLGTSLMMQQKFPEAKEHLTQSLLFDPTNKKASSNLRLTLAWLGRYPEASANAPTGEAGDVYNNVGYIAMLNGDYDVARRFFLRAMEESPVYHEKAARNLDALELLSAAQEDTN